MKNDIRLRDKIIFVMLVVVILGNFIFSKPVKAGPLVEIGGEILEELTTFVRVIGDVVLNALQKNFYVDQNVVINANAPEAGWWDWESLAWAGVGLTVVVAGIVLAAPTGRCKLRINSSRRQNNFCYFCRNNNCRNSYIFY